MQKDIERSLDAKTGSSSYPDNIPDVGTSHASSIEEKIRSDIQADPLQPEMKLNARMKKQNLPENKGTGEILSSLITKGCENNWPGDDGQVSHGHGSGDKAVSHDKWPPPACQVKSVPQRNVDSAPCRGGSSNADGAPSSPGVWTECGSGASDMPDNIRTTPSHSQIITQRELLRPQSLSRGVVFEPGSAPEITHKESNNTLNAPVSCFQEGVEEGLIHSSDAEGLSSTAGDAFDRVTNKCGKQERMISAALRLQASNPRQKSIKAPPPPPIRKSSLLNKGDQNLSVQGDAVEQKDNRENKFSDQSEDPLVIKLSEHPERQELKEAINSWPIPSMIITTPPLSNDESEKNGANRAFDVYMSGADMRKKSLKSNKNACEARTNNKSVNICDENSGKLPSTAPDIVKPVQGSNHLKSRLKIISTHQKTGLHPAKIAMIKRPLPPTPESASCLPDMLTNTPAAAHHAKYGPSAFYDPRKQLRSITNSLGAKDDLVQKSEMPVQNAKGLPLGHATKTSCSENHAENTAPPALLSSVSGGQPNSEQPKLRITSPFSAYSKKYVSDKNDSCHMKIPPSTLQTLQGDFGRNVMHSEAKPKNDVQSSEIIEQNIHKGSKLSEPKSLHNTVNQTLSSMNSDTSVGQNSNGIDGSRNSVQRSSLKRSDSYRRARTILSPDLSRNNRKSLEIAATNNNTTVISKNLTNKSASEKLDNSPILASSNEKTMNAKKEPEKGKDVSKNNFFKNLRSQFSFSSLRVKKATKKNVTISSPLELNQTSDLKRRNSFSSVTVSNKSPQQPQMTSTPVSGCSTVNKTNGELKKENPNLKSSGEWPDSPKTSMSSGVKFRTTALKNQHQRWSLAEQQASNRQCVVAQPNGTSYGYIQPNQYMLAGHAPHGHNIYPHIHHHPHHHPLVSCSQIYSTCCLAAPNPAFLGSQRSSIASLRGLTHGKKIANNTP